MKSMKKWLCMLMVLAMTMTMLAGCGNTEEPAAEEPSTEETAAEAPAATEETTNEEVAVLELWTGEAHAEAVMKEIFEEFNNTTGKEVGIELVYVVKSDLGQAVTVACETEQEPAFFYTGNIIEFSEKDWIVPINSLSGSEEIIKRAEEHNVLVEGSHKYNGNVYCIPFMASSKGLLYNKDMFVEAGLVDENGEAKAPTTMEELREYAKILTDDSKQQYGFVLPLKWADVFNSEIALSTDVSSGYIAGYNPETGEFDYSTMKPVLETFLAMKEDGSIMPGAEGLDNDTARARFAAGQIGMKYGWYWDVGVLTTQFPAECEWGVAPLPVADADNSYSATYGINSGYRISKSGVEKYGEEKIMIAYNFLYSEEVMGKLYANGIYLPCYKGISENYEIVDESLANWKVFAQLLEDSIAQPQVVKTEVTGTESLADNYVNKVWYGDMSLDDALATETQNKNEGAAKYKELNPDYDASAILVENWFETVKK